MARRRPRLHQTWASGCRRFYSRSILNHKVEVQIALGEVGFAHTLPAGLWSWLSQDEFEALIKDYRKIQRKRRAISARRALKK